MSKRIYLDLEYCFPGMTREIGRPTSADLRQVIQIAAICYDHRSGMELESFNMLVTPFYTKMLPDFFIELTGITQESVESKAVPFIEAIEQLVTFCKGNDIYTFDKDWFVLKQNCSYYDQDFPFQTQPFYRIKKQLKIWGLPQDKYSSGTLYEAAGLTMEGHVHNALHDVRSMAAATRHFDQLGQ